MEEVIKKRFEELVAEGRKLSSQVTYGEMGKDQWVNDQRVPEYQAWLSSASNLIKTVAPSDSYFVQETERIAQHDRLKTGVPFEVIHKMLGVIIAAESEWKAGLFRKIEYVVAAATFDDFLDHAMGYHKAGKKIESAVLASVVLEDVIKKIARKNCVEPQGMSLDPLVDELVKKGVFTLVKAKRIKGWTGVRNPSLHAEWDKLDLKDINDLIEGTRELLESYL